MGLVDDGEKVSIKIDVGRVAGAGAVDRRTTITHKLCNLRMISTSYGGRILVG